MQCEKQLPDKPRLTLATYNIHGCIGADGRYDPRRIAQVLQELNADVIALQEVENLQSVESDLLRYLAAESRMVAIAGPTLLRRSGQYGNALLTRVPVARTNRVDLSIPHREPRGALDVLLRWQGRPVQVIATHLGLRPGERRDQVRRLLGLYDSTPSEMEVLMGDINEWFLWGRPLRWLRRYFARTPHHRTWPARLPLFALDRIWIQPWGSWCSIETHKSSLARIASDHLPLRATIGMPPSGESDQA